MCAWGGREPCAHAKIGRDMYRKRQEQTETQDRVKKSHRNREDRWREREMEREGEGETNRQYYMTREADHNGSTAQHW